MSQQRKENKKATEYKNKGNKSFGEKKYKESIDWYTKAIKADPGDPAFYSNRCAAYSALGQHDKALEDANLCIKTDTKWAKGYYRKATVLISLNNHPEAKKVLEEGLKQEPNNADLMKKLSEIKIVPENKPKQTTDDGKPLTDAQKAKEEGNFHYKESRYDKAIECYTKAISLTTDPKEKAVFLNNRAACKAQLQMYQEVVQDCHLVLEMDPDNVKALLRRGLAYENKEIYRLAKNDMKRALELEPSARQASEALVRLERNIRLMEKMQN